MVAYKTDRSVKLISRQGVDHTSRYPDIVAALRALEVPTLILDGEIAVFDQKLISRFEWLRHTAPPGLATPPIFRRSIASMFAARISAHARSTSAATWSRTCWTART